MYTFTDWNNYTDLEGNPRTLDWSSEEAIRGKFCSAYIDALHQAANFRDHPLWWTPISESYFPPPPAYAWRANLPTIIQYIDRQAWLGKVSPYGNWISGYYTNDGEIPTLTGPPSVVAATFLDTDEKILAEIGDVSRIPSSYIPHDPSWSSWGDGVYPITAAWVYQVYKILRAKRWLWGPFSDIATTQFITTAYEYKFGFSTVGWEEAAAEFNASTWSTTPPVYALVWKSWFPFGSDGRYTSPGNLWTGEGPARHLAIFRNANYWSQGATPYYYYPYGPAYTSDTYEIGRCRAQLKYVAPDQAYAANLYAYHHCYDYGSETWDTVNQTYEFSCVDYNSAAVEDWLLADGPTYKPDNSDVSSGLIGNFDGITTAYPTIPPDPTHWGESLVNIARAGWAHYWLPTILADFNVEGGFPLM